MPGKPAAAAEAYGAAYRAARAIRQEPYCPNPSLQKVQAVTRRKDARNRRRPLLRSREISAAIPRGAGAMPSQGIKGGRRDA